MLPPTPAGSHPCSLPMFRRRVGRHRTGRARPDCPSGTRPTTTMKRCARAIARSLQILSSRPCSRLLRVLLRNPLCLTLCRPCRYGLCSELCRLPYAKVRLRGEVHRLVAPRDQKYQSNFVEVSPPPNPLFITFSSLFIIHYRLRAYFVYRRSHILYHMTRPRDLRLVSTLSRAVAHLFLRSRRPPGCTLPTTYYRYQSTST
jgi:hypothetical protein